MGTILSILGFVGTYWKAIALTVAITAAVGLGLYLKNEIARSATLQEQLNQAEQVANDNKQALITYKSNQDALLKSLAAQHVEDVKRLQQASKLHQQIKDTKPSSDGIVAPVLKNTIEGLRGNQ